MILITLIKSVEDENSFIGLLMILASGVSLKIFADAFSLWENHCCWSAFDIWKNLPKSVAQRLSRSCLWMILVTLIKSAEQACTTQKARKAKLININSPRAAKVYFVIVEEILKGQVITRSRAFATFSATEFLQAACGPRAVCCAGLV